MTDKEILLAVITGVTANPEYAQFSDETIANKAINISNLLTEKINEKVQEMEKDGLVEISENTIKITEKGRAFTRNVAMTFDLRMMRNKPETRIFSMTI